MRTIALRLIDLMDNEDEELIEFDEQHSALYWLVVKNYYNAYINADSKDEFCFQMKRTWDRCIAKYSPLINRASELYNNLFVHRDSTLTFDKDETTTPNTTETNTYTLGDTVTNTYGSTMSMGHVTTQDTTTNKQYTEQTGLTEHTHNSTDTNTKTGSDTSSRSGQNINNKTNTGNTKFIADNENTELTKEYDVDKFGKIAREVNLYDTWIDEFATLFNDIMFAC